MSDIQDEAYSELCEENARLKSLLTRAAEALENKQWNVVNPDDLNLIAELRKRC